MVRIHFAWHELVGYNADGSGWISECILGLSWYQEGSEVYKVKKQEHFKQIFNGNAFY